MRPTFLRFSLLLVIGIVLFGSASLLVTAQDSTPTDGTPVESTSSTLEVNCGATKIIPDHTSETPVPTVMAVDYVCTTYDVVSTNLSVSAIYTVEGNQSLSFDQGTPVAGYAGNMLIFVLDGSLNVTIVDLCSGNQCESSSATANHSCLPATSATDSCAEYGVIDPSTHTIQWSLFELNTMHTVDAGQVIRMRFVRANIQAGDNGAIIGTSGGNIVGGGGCPRSCIQPAP